MKRILSIVVLISIVVFASCGNTSNDKSGTGAEVAGKQNVDISDSAVINEHVSKIDPQVKAEFDSLHADWYEAMLNTPEVALSSNMSAATSLPQYEQLVKMGDEILPLVVDKMTDEKFFFTLNIYEELRPTDKKKLSNEPNISGQNKAKEYVKMWLNNH